MAGTRANPSQSILSARSLATILFVRTVVNLDFRIVYPFLPAIARGLNVPLEVAGQLVAVQGGASLVAPLFGHLSDRYGRRRLMEAGLLLLMLAALAVAISDQYVPALLAFAGFGVAKALFDPAMQAYIGDAVPYERRGRVFAVTELAWSFAWLFGVPVSGLLIERVGWQAPWWLLAGLALVSLLATRLLLSPARRAPLAKGEKHTPLLGGWATLLRQPKVRALLVVGFGMMFATENVFIVYGAFLEDQFGLAIGAIGLVSTVIGLAELFGEGGAAAITDRLGKQRSVVLGLLCFGGMLLVLPWLGGSLAATLLGFAVMIFFFEYTIVSFIPLVSEVAPHSRATLLSMNVGMLGAGRMVAPLFGTLLYQRTGALFANSALSAVACLVCAAVAWRWLEETGSAEGGTRNERPLAADDLPAAK
jgi:predicted MFS family arabinose efflux permease